MKTNFTLFLLGKKRLRTTLPVVFLLFFSSIAVTQTPVLNAFLINNFAAFVVSGTSPSANMHNAPRNSNVVLTFSDALVNNASTKEALKVFSAQSGGQLNRTGSGVASVSGSSLTFNPNTDFKPGETIQGTITTAASSAGGNLIVPKVFKFTAAAGVGPGVFQASSSFTVNQGPYAMVTGDLDGDGDLDLVACSVASNNISIKLNDGSGNFSVTKTLSISKSTYYVELADVDGDGDLDILAVSAGSPSSVSISLNDGNGNFSAETIYATGGGNALSLKTGDIDGDGDLDLVIAHSIGIEWRKNEGSGNFGPAITIASFPNAFNLLLEDLDGDGDLDLIANSQTSKLIVRLNDGLGNFAGSAIYNANSGRLVAGDVDGDGHIDIINCGQGTGAVFLFRNDGTGNLTSATIPNAAVSSMGLALADVDGDGDLDLLSARLTNNESLQVLLNDGTGNFGTAVNYGGRGFSLATGDLDGDGDLDVLMGDLDGGNGTSVQVLLNAPPLILETISPTHNVPRNSNVVLTFNQPIHNDVNTLDALKVFSAQGGGQLNRTGAGIASVSGSTLTFNPNTDFKPGETIQGTITTAASSAGGNLIAPKVFKFTAAAGVGPGVFQASSSFTVNPGPYAMVTGDLDGDGDLDLVACSVASNNISIKLNDGSGNFSVTKTLSISKPTRYVELADVDGDGDLDILAVSPNSPSSVSVSLNDGNGNFSGETIYPTSGNAFSLKAGDIDGDGDLDLIIAYNTGIEWRKNDGSGNFGPTIQIASFPDAFNLLLEDLDGDGDLDLIANSQASKLIVRLNDGLGNFSGSDVFNANSGRLVAGDVDGDGHIDIINCGQGGEAVFLFRNDGTGKLTSGTIPNASVSSMGLALADVDGDGDLDLLSAQLTNNESLQVLLNDGTGNFGTAVNYGGRGFSLATGDLDGDGDLDVLLGDFDGSGGTSVQVLLNALPVPTLTFAATATKTYGDIDYSPGATSSNAAIPITYSSDKAAVATIVAGKIHITGAGTANITAAQAGDANYLPASAVQILTVNPKDLTLTADDMNRLQLDPNPALTYSDAGFVNGDTKAVLSPVPVLSTTAVQNSAPGDYPIAISGAAAANYSIHYEPGTLTVDPFATDASLTALVVKSSAGNVPLNRVFDPAITEYTASVTNATGSVTLAPTVSHAHATVTVNGTLVSSGDASASIPLTVGSNTILVKITAQDGQTTTTYTVVVSRDKATQTITFANAATKTYGDIDYNPGASSSNATIPITYSSDKAAVATIVAGKIHITGAGTANITATQAGDANYLPASVVQILTVNPKDLTLTADDMNRVQLNPNPTLTYSDAGFVNGDTKAVLSPVPVLSTTAVQNSVPGDYPITISGAAAANYSIHYEPGTLTVIPGSVTGIALDAATLYENRPVGTIAGTLSSTSNIPNTTFSYTLVAGAGSDDNALFTISGDQLKTDAVLDFETKANYSVLIRSTAAGGQSTDRPFTIALNDVNEQPELAAIANQHIIYTAENQSIQLSGIGPGPESNQSLSLSASSSNAGLFENLSVAYSGGSTASLNYKIKAGQTGTATVTVVVEDGGGTDNGGNNTFSRSFTLTISLPALATVSANNVLTPNGDGKNDFLVFKNLDAYPDNTLKLFDRGGRVIYQAINYQNNWDGLVNGSPLKEDTYYYLLEIGKDKNVKKGFISIIRNK
jgi:gliding motility-associated-like protein